MEEREIIKANDLCSKIPQQCKDCPFCKFDDCVSELSEKTIDLINRQQAEIERLQYKVKRLKEYDEQRDIALHSRLIATSRAEAVKEFAERLKGFLDDFYHAEEDALLETSDLIDNLVKETEGEG